MSGNRSINQGLVTVFIVLFSLGFAVIVGYYTPGDFAIPGIAASMIFAGVAALASSWHQPRNYLKILFSVIGFTLGAFFLLEHYYLGQIVSHNLMGIMMNLAFLGLFAEAFIGAILFLEG